MYVRVRLRVLRVCSPRVCILTLHMCVCVRAYVGVNEEGSERQDTQRDIHDY